MAVAFHIVDKSVALFGSIRDLEHHAEIACRRISYTAPPGKRDGKICRKTLEAELAKQITNTERTFDLMAPLNACGRHLHPFRHHRSDLSEASLQTCLGHSADVSGRTAGGWHV